LHHQTTDPGSSLPPAAGAADYGSKDPRSRWQGAGGEGGVLFASVGREGRGKEEFHLLLVAANARGRSSYRPTESIHVDREMNFCALIHASNYACVTSVVGYMSLSSCVVPQDIYPALLRLDDYPLDLATDLGRLEPFERKRRRHLQSELGRHTHTVQKTGGELHKRSSTDACIDAQFKKKSSRSDKTTHSGE
jgi:hypothetical protein